MALNKAIRGITIEIGGDTTKLSKAIGGIDSQLNSTQSKLKDVNKLLKMDPSNVTLLTQKQKDLKDAIDSTKDRLKTLKSVQTDSLSPDAYDALQREIIETEQKLDSLKQDYKDFGSVSGQVLKAAGDKIKDTGKKISDVGQSLSTKLTLPLVAVGTAGVTAFAEVDKTMQLTNKTMGHTEEEAQLLNQAMKDAAANSTYGMKDAANATLNFARAGLDAEQAAAALAPAMNLAAGEGGNLDTVSAGLVATINGFHDSFENAGKYADVFAAACNNSALDVDSLSSAMSVAAPVFAAAGYSVNDAALYMGVMANNGIEANKAANALKTGFSRLASGGGECGKMMKKLGISVTNADGTMKDSVTIQKELHAAFGKLSESEQIAAASALFGKNQMAPWLALINTAPEDVSKLSTELDGASLSVDSFSKQLKKSGTSYDDIKTRMKKLGISGDAVDQMFKECKGNAELFTEGLLEAADAGVTMDDITSALGISMDDLQTALDNTTGTTEEMADAMMSGFGGSIEKLKSSLDVLVTSIGEALAPTIQKVTEFIQNLVDKFNALTPAQQETIAKIGLVVAAIGPALIVIGKVVTGVGGIVSAIGGFLSAVGGLLPGGIIIVGLIAAGTLITRHWDEIKAWATETLIPALMEAWESLKEGIGVVIDNLKAFWTDTLEPAWNDMWTWVEETLIPALVAAWEGFREGVGVVFDALKEFWTTTLQPALQDMWTWIQDTLIPALEQGWEDFKTAVGVVFEALKAFWTNTLLPALQNMWTWIVETLIPAIQQGWEDFKVAVGIVFDALKKFWTETLQPTLQAMWTWIIETLIPAVQKGWEDFKTAVGVVFEALKGFWNDTLKPVLSAMWTWIVTTMIPAVQTGWENFKEAVSVVFTAMKEFWTVTLKPALQAMWTWLTESLIPAVQTAWENLRPKVEAVFNALKSFWVDVLSPALMTMKTWIKETLIPAIQKAWEDLQPKVEAVFNAIKGFWTDTLKPAFEAIKKYLEETLKPIFDNTFNAIKTIVDNTLNAIDDLWNKTVKPIYDGIVKFFSGVFKGDWETAWKGIGEIVDGIWNGIQTAAELAWENAKTWGTTIIANFTIAFNNAWALVKNSVLGIWDTITEKVKTIWEDAKNWGTSIIGNFYMSVVNAWKLAVDYVTGIWDAITDKVTKIWEAAKEWGTNIVTNFKNSISEAWTTAIEEIKGWFNQIPETIQSIVDSALNWGKDLIQNFKDGISQKWEDLKKGVSDIGQGIKDFLGFSKPKEGPLSDFDTYAPDMIALFVKGISDNIKLIVGILQILTTSIVLAFKLTGSSAYSEFNTALNGEDGNQLKNAIKNPVEQAADAIKAIDWQGMGSGAYNSFTEGLNGYWGDQLKNAIKSPIEQAADAIRQIDWYGIGRSIYDGMTYYTSWISDAYKNAFDFSNMYVKTPHWWVDRWNEISGTYYPEMSVHWYKKAYENPIMFTNPTVLGTAGGLKGFGDGPGGEIVLSADKLREIVGEAGDVNINVYAQPGQDAQHIAQEVQRILVREQRQRSAAYA